ncbi:MAG: cupin domain-containing protein [Balneolales bacterium]
MVFKNDEIKKQPVDQGISRQVIAHDSELMMVKVEFERDAIGLPHSHPHRQTSYVVSGKFELTIEGKKSIIVEGDSFFIPPNVEHGVVALIDGILIDAFSPARIEFINQG